MDFGDLANFNSGKKAEDAARAANEAKHENKKLRKAIQRQEAARETEKELASGLYELTSELDNDFKTLTYEPTEESAERIANRYIRYPIDDYIDQNNHSALEYKELANKTKETYKQLTENEWFKWGVKKAEIQIAYENEQIAIKIAQEEKEAAEFEKKQEDSTSAKFTYISTMFVFGLMGVFTLAPFFMGLKEGFKLENLICSTYSLIFTIYLGKKLLAARKERIEKSIIAGEEQVSSEESSLYKKTAIIVSAVVVIGLVVGCGYILHLNNTKNYWDEELKTLRNSAEAGDADAQYNLGQLYEKGDWGLNDVEEAEKWYQKAADQGHTDAQFSLGYMYSSGERVLKDHVTAYAWYNIASANGDDSAMWSKGIIAKNMTPEQIAKAQELYKEMVKKNPKLINE